MLSCDELEQEQLQAINSNKRLTMHNVIHLSIGHVLGMNADSVGLEALKSEVKDEPNDDEDVGEDVLEEYGVSDLVLSADSDTKNEDSMGHLLEMDADSVDVDTPVVFRDVKDEQSEPKSDSTQKEPSQNVQKTSEDSISSNLNEHELVQDTRQKLQEVTATGLIDDNKDKTASVQYTCDTCLQFCSSRSNLKRHVRLCSKVWKKDERNENTTSTHIHTVQKPHQYDVCKKHFSRIHHLNLPSFKDSNEMPYHCNECKKQYCQKKQFIVHMRTHTGEKPYHCNTCSKKFSEKSYLITHLRRHTGEKPYHCITCSKKFLEKSYLLKHMRTHTGEKPFQCDICSKIFSAKYNLTKHMRTHTGEKPYHCNICSKKCSEKSNLIKHMRTHTGEKPYQRNTCSKKKIRKE